MFRSLRFRLWLSYLIVFGVTFLVVLFGLIWSIQRSPFFYRQTALNIQLSGALIAMDLLDSRVDDENNPSRLLKTYGEERQVAAAVMDNQFELIAQYGFSHLPTTPRLKIQTANEDNYGKILTFRDAEGKIWFYSLFPLKANSILIIAAPRPRIGLFMLLRQGFEPLIFFSMIIAFFLALIISILMANWIGSPLQHLALAAQKLAIGEYQKVPLQGPEDIQQVAATFNEMTDRLKLSQQSQQDFIANVSHELKTPLTSIQGFAQAILDDTVQSKEELEKAAEIIYDESGRMHRLVNDLLSLSRLESGLADFVFSEVRLDNLLEKVMESFRLKFQQKEIELQVRLGMVSPIRGDADKLSQLFGNLMDNAIKFTSNKGSILLQAEEFDRVIEIRIVDSGPGIPVNERKRVFERFYQVEKSRKGGTERGVGLGLPIAQQIVLAHNGTIRVEDSPASGTNFIVTLPVSSKLNQNGD